MSMNGNEFHQCDECGCEDFECFMVERGDEFYCKECDPGEEPAADEVDYHECHRNGGTR
jgi:hypothetical protein